MRHIFKSAKLGNFSWFWLGAWLLSLSTHAVLAAEATPSIPSQTRVIPLEYKQVDYAVTHWGLQVARQSAPFKKEPAWGKAEVARGTFQLTSKTNGVIPFAWDYKQGRLYLDHNLNGDLIDDRPEGYACREQEEVRSSRSYYNQTFTNIQLQVKVGESVRKALVDLSLYNFGQGVNGSMGVRFFWEGKINLGGEDWQIGIIEQFPFRFENSLPDHILLRPWKNRERFFSVQDGSLDAFKFTRRLFFRNQEYQLSWGPVNKLEWTEQSTKLGELNLTGKFLQRVLLGQPDCTVLLDAPKPTEKIPVGNYSWYKVALQAGTNSAYGPSDRTPITNQISVSERKAAVLNAGGPLRNSVSLQRRGKHLTLNYQVLGMDGQSYTMSRQDQSKPPQFTIYRGDKRLASGKFEFG